MPGFKHRTFVFVATTAQGRSLVVAHQYFLVRLGTVGFMARLTDDFASVPQTSAFRQQFVRNRYLPRNDIYRMRALVSRVDPADCPVARVAGRTQR